MSRLHLLGTLSLGGLLGLPPSPVTATLTSFEDIRGHWSQFCVEQLAQANLVSAFRDGTFGPDQPLTRELYADLLARSFPNVPEVQPSTVFLDLSPVDSQTDKIYQTYRQGFFTGIAPGRFGPTLPISRQDFFVALAQGLGYRPNLDPLGVLQRTYDDALTLKPYGVAAVAAATERGFVVSGSNRREFRPQDPITRAEAAAVICQIRQTDRSPSPVPAQYVVELPTLPEPRQIVRFSLEENLEVELNYRKENYQFQDVTLGIRRNDRLMLQQAIPMEGGFARNLGLQVKDLDGDLEPEVILSFFAGGDRCCSYSQIYSYLPRRQDYGRTQQSWGYGDYVLVDLDQDGRPEFLSRDPRFTLRFASFIGDAVMPLQIWQYRQGQLFDVTRLYPTFLEKDAAQLWSLYQTRQSLSPDLRSPSLKPVLAAYAATQFLLGHGREGFAQAEAGYDGSDRSSYLEDLRRFLRGTGYTNH